MTKLNKFKFASANSASKKNSEQKKLSGSKTFKKDVKH